MDGCAFFAWLVCLARVRLGRGAFSELSQAAAFAVLFLWWNTWGRLQRSQSCFCGGTRGAHVGMIGTQHRGLWISLAAFVPSAAAENTEDGLDPREPAGKISALGRFCLNFGVRPFLAGPAVLRWACFFRVQRGTCRPYRGLLSPYVWFGPLLSFSDLVYLPLVNIVLYVTPHDSHCFIYHV